jgi:hypothetical protein
MKARELVDLIDKSDPKFPMLYTTLAEADKVIAAGVNPEHVLQCLLGAATILAQDNGVNHAAAKLMSASSSMLVRGRSPVPHMLDGFKLRQGSGRGDARQAV